MKSVDKIRKRSMHFNLAIKNHSPIAVRKLIILFHANNQKIPQGIANHRPAYDI